MLAHLLVVLLLASCSSEKQEVQVINGKAFDSIFFKILIGQSIDDDKLKSIDEEIKKELHTINDVFSTWKGDSEISRFNQTENNTWFIPSESFWALLERSNELHKLTDGYLDIALGNAINYYGFGNENPKKLGDIGFTHLKIDVPNKQIKKLKSIKLNMSSLVEGFALIKIEKLLLDSGVDNFLIELGGEIIVRGSKFGEKWTIAIEKPNADKQELQEIIKVKSDRLVMDSSGGYKNFNKATNNTHIINPHTGKPSTTKLFSVSIIDDDAIKADGVATAMVAMGVKKSIAFADKHNIAAYITYFDDDSKKFKAYITDAWLTKVE